MFKECRKSRQTWLGTFGTNLIILGSGITTGVLSARLLLPEGRGALAATLFWPQIAEGVGILSLNEAIAHHASRPGSNIKEIRITAFWLAITLSIVTSCILYFLLPSLLGEHRSDLIPMSRVYAVFFLPASFVALNLLAIDQGSMNFSRFNLLRMVSPVIYLVGIICLWFLNMVSVRNIVFAAIVGAVSSALLRFALAGGRMKGLPQWGQALKLLKTGWSYHLTNMTMFAGNEIDKFMILLLADNKALGFYICGLAVASTGLNVIAQTFRHVLFPTISNLDSRDEQRQVLSKQLRLSGFLLISLQLGLAVLSPFLVPALFGESFSAAVPITILLLVAFAFKGIRSIMVYSLRAMGETRVGTIAEGVVPLTFVVLSVPLSNIGGLPGIGIALLISHMISVLFLSNYLRKEHDLHMRDWWGVNLLTAKQTLALLIKWGNR